MGVEEQKEVFRALTESKVFRNFAHDFTVSTGLPLSLTPAESWHLAYQGQSQQSPFCQMLAQQSHACAACLRTQQRIADATSKAARTTECVHGLTETAVPVRAGELLFGFIRTGQVFRRPPTRQAFARVLKQLADWNVTLDTGKLRRAFFATRVVSPAQYRAHVGLLHFLAEHLSLLSNRIRLQRTHTENPIVSQAKQFMEQNYAQPLTLHIVAEAVNTSACHFCKVFKRVTGINLTVYLSRLRVEKAKNLMLNPHYRISEVAFAAGYGSLTHFNRVFKRATGLQPKEYRLQLARELNGNKKARRPGLPDQRQ